MAITVAIAEARIFTRLLPIKIIPISLSGRASNLYAFLAPRLFFLRCFNRYLLRDIIAVSELEKNADNINKPPRIKNSNFIEVSFKEGEPFFA